MILAALVQLRPFFYHLTAKENVPALMQQRRLLSARTILELGGHVPMISTRRLQCETVEAAGARYVVRDQRPLQPGNMRLDEGMAFGQFVELLNGLIFFWPGSERGPIEMGLRHFERYSAEQPVILRVEFGALLDANPGVTPKVAKVNSGAPRCNPKTGKGRRGLDTFVVPELFHGAPGEVKEVVFERSLRLPIAMELGAIDGRVWVKDA